MGGFVPGKELPQASSPLCRAGIAGFPSPLSCKGSLVLHLVSTLPSPPCPHRVLKHSQPCTPIYKEFVASRLWAAPGARCQGSAGQGGEACHIQMLCLPSPAMGEGHKLRELISLRC